MRHHLLSVVKYWSRVIRDGVPGMIASIAGAVVISYTGWVQVAARLGAAPPAPAAAQPTSADSLQKPP